jgi:hypothetical protein
MEGFELGLPALVTSTITITPLRMTFPVADNEKTSSWVCLLAFRWGLGSNLLGSLFLILQSKNNIYKQSCALAR